MPKLTYSTLDPDALEELEPLPKLSGLPNADKSTQLRIAKLIGGEMKPNLNKIEVATGSILDTYDAALAGLANDMKINGSNVNEGFVNGLADIAASMNVMSEEVDVAQAKIDQLCII
ncbi:MAG: hypothetical protein HAW67_02335 [Endozoicomonadaceae bacterium]|nr:hypothetical protein [Endozoicomonadaceae bacterium]